MKKTNSIYKEIKYRWKNKKEFVKMIKFAIRWLSFNLKEIIKIIPKIGKDKIITKDDKCLLNELDQNVIKFIVCPKNCIYYYKHLLSDKCSEIYKKIKK
jgi:hypothetical protein